MEDNKVLVAKPRDTIRYMISEKPLDKASIYIGELATKAILELNELSTSGNIRPLEAQDLRLKCNNMLHLLERAQKNISWMENLCGEMIQEDRRIASAFRQRAEFPDGFNSSADELRKQALAAENEAMEVELNMDALDYNIVLLEEERKMLGKQAEKYPSEETVKEKRKQLDRQMDSLSVELHKYTLESCKLRRELNTATATKEDLRNRLGTSKDHLASSVSEFELLQSKTRKLMQENSDLEKNLKIEQESLLVVDEDIKNKLRERAYLIVTKDGLESETERLSQQIRKKQETIDCLNDRLGTVRRKCQELCTEESKFRAEMSKMELNLENMKEEKSIVRESTKGLVKATAAEIKRLRENKKKAKSLTEAIDYLENKKRDFENELALLKKLRAQSKHDERNQLNKEISQFTLRIMKQTSLSERDREVITELMNDEEALLREIDSLKLESTHLQRVVTVKSNETSQKRGFLETARQHEIQVISELKLQQLQLVDNKKIWTSFKNRLLNFMKIFEAVNVERNECLTMINLAQQQQLEQEEKRRLLSNELTILESALSNKHAQLDDLSERKETIQKKKIALRGSISKESQINRDLSVQKARLATSIGHMNRLLRENERAIGQLERGKTAVAAARDACKLNLDQLDEDSVLAESNLHSLESELKTNSEALASTNLQLDSAKRDKKEELRQIEIARQRDFARRQTVTELSNVRSNLVKSQCWLSHLIKLSDDLNPVVTQRFRMLHGPDPNPVALKSSEQMLKRRIGRKNAMLHQRERIHSASDRLIAQLNLDVREGNAGFLHLAKLMVATRQKSQLKESEWKALAAELRMKIFNANCLKTAAEEIDFAVQEARQYLFQRDAPMAGWHNERRLLRRRDRIGKRILEKCELNATCSIHDGPTATPQKPTSVQQQPKFGVQFQISAT